VNYTKKIALSVFSLMTYKGINILLLSVFMILEKLKKLLVLYYQEFFAFPMDSKKTPHAVHIFVSFKL